MLLPKALGRRSTDNILPQKSLPLVKKATKTISTTVHTVNYKKKKKKILTNLYNFKKNERKENRRN